MSVLLRVRRSRRAVLVAVLAVCAASGATAYAASLSLSSSRLTGWHSATAVVCTPATLTATANADSYVDQDNAGTPYGSSSIMKVRSQLAVVILGGGDARGLVRFTLPATPDLCSMTGATLRLYASSVDSGRTLNATAADAAWAESSVTWNNRPGPTGPVATAPSRSTAGYVVWTVTSQVAAMYAGPNNGFVVRDSVDGFLLSGSHEQRFDTRLTANPPQLVVTFG